MQNNGRAMEISYTDLNRYFEKPPTMLELMGKTTDRRGWKKREVLVIIAAYQDEERLKIALSALRGQTFTCFDVAIIYGAEDRFVYDEKLSILHVRRRINLGFAGAIYLGQVIAFSEGYKYFIAVDVDRVPSSKESLKNLYDAVDSKGLDYVVGNWGEVSKQATSAFLGGIVRTEILKKTGLYALPLYIGYEDLEFHYRLMKASNKCEYLRYRTHRIFSNDVPLFESKLINLIKKGGVDMTYQYTNLIGIYTMPEVLLDLSIYRSAEKSFFLRRSILAMKFMFVLNLFQRLFEIRFPALREYRERAKKSQYAIAFWKNARDSCEELRSQKPLISLTYSKKTRSGLPVAISAFFNSSSAQIEHDIYVLLYDSCFVWIPGPSNYSLKWRRKCPLPRKALCFILAFADTFSDLFCMAKNMLAGKHAFDRYGASVLQDGMGTDRAAG